MRIVNHEMLQVARLATGVNQEALLAAAGVKQPTYSKMENGQAGIGAHAPHFSVDGTLLQAWASHKSFKPKPDPDQQPPQGP